MSLVLVLFAGWFVLSVVCFTMGTGFFRTRADNEVDADLRRLIVPAPRAESARESIAAA